MSLFSAGHKGRCPSPLLTPWPAHPSFTSPPHTPTLAPLFCSAAVNLLQPAPLSPLHCCCCCCCLRCHGVYLEFYSSGYKEWRLNTTEHGAGVTELPESSTGVSVCVSTSQAEAFLALLIHDFFPIVFSSDPSFVV